MALQATNLELTAGAGQRVTVPARDRVEVRFPATTVKAGTARFQVAAVSGAFADAATVELPVYTPATTEAFATYGVVDEGAIAQPVAAVGDGVFSQFGGLEISTSSTALQALTDAVLYLVSYRFECSEQLASRILAVSALRDVLQAFSAEGLPSPEEMESAVKRDIERLQALQNDDGGFPYWSRGRESIPFNTIHVAHALQRAESMDFAVPPDMRSRVLDYLRQIESYYPSWYDEDTRQTLSAYALYVRNLMGDGDAAKAQQLLAKAGLEKLSLDAVAWLWQVLLDDPGSAAEVEAIARHIANRAVETAGAANFTTSYSDQTYLLLRSDRRTDAIILDALIAADPQSDLIPKVVNGLLAHRTKGRWDNTQENVFVLLALDRYFNTFESQTPDFVARIWLGDAYVGEHAYHGRTTERHEIQRPHVLPDLARVGAGPDRQQGGARAALLPAGAALRAHRPDARPAGHGLCRPAQLRGGGRPGRRDPGRGRRLAHQGRGTRARPAHDGGRQPALPRGPGRPAARRAGDRQPGPGRLGRRSPGSQLARTIAMAGGGGAPGTSTRTCATSAPRPLPRCCGKASTTIPTSPGPPRPGPSSCRRPRPRRCTRPRSLAAAAATG